MKTTTFGTNSVVTALAAIAGGLLCGCNQMSESVLDESAGMFVETLLTATGGGGAFSESPLHPARRTMPARAVCMTWRTPRNANVQGVDMEAIRYVQSNATQPARREPRGLGMKSSNRK